MEYKENFPLIKNFSPSQNMRNAFVDANNYSQVFKHKSQLPKPIYLNSQNNLPTPKKTKNFVSGHKTS